MRNNYFKFMVVLTFWSVLFGCGQDAEPVRADTVEFDVIEETLPIFDGREVREPRPDDEFPPMRVLLSRERYWAQDGHMDVVVRLEAPEDVSMEETELGIKLKDENGRKLSASSINPVPHHQFIFYPHLPSELEGEALIELTWSRGGEVIAEDEQPFRVERYVAPASAEGRIELEVPNGQGVVQTGLPVTAGVPFPRGVLEETDNLRLVDEAGEEVPLQVKETARWSKFGSVKWLRCDFTVDLDGRARKLYLEYGPDVTRTDHRELTVDDSNTGFPVINTGRLRFDDGLWFDAEGDGDFVKVLEESALTGAFVEHEDARTYRMQAKGDYEIEEQGPGKVVIKREGWYREENEERDFCKYVVRYVIHRDSPMVRIFYSWIFTEDSNRDRIANMGWEFALSDGLEPSGYLTSFGDDGAWHTGDYLLQWDYEHFDIVDGQTVEEFEGGRAPGAAKAEGPGVRLYFGAKDFWQNYPSELEFRDGSFFFHNWPRHNRPEQYTLDKELGGREEPALPSAARYARESEDRLTRSEWKLNVVQSRFAHEGQVLDFRVPEAYARDPIQRRVSRDRGGSMPWGRGDPEAVNAQGISRTEEMWIYLAGPDEGTDQDAVRLLEGLDRERLRTVVDPRWVARSGAFYEMHHQDRESFPEEEHIYEQVAYSYARLIERLGLYGMWLHGDIAAWGPRLPDREPDLYRALRKRHHGWPYSWKPYARSGDSDLLKIAEAATRQMIDASFRHFATDAVAEGTRHFHDIGHTRRWILPWGGGYVRAYECQIDYYWHAYYLTGYHRARDTVKLWAEQASDFGDASVRGFGGNRGAHTTLRSFLEMYEATFDPRFLVAAHAYSEGFLSNYRRGSVGRAWDSNNREFLRFTGSREFREWYEAFAGAHASPKPPNRELRWKRRHPQLAAKSYMYNLTGDEYYARRVRHAIDHGTAIVRYGPGEPDYMQGYVRRGHGTGYSLFTGYYLRWFPTGLWALNKAGKQLDPVPNTFQVTVPRIETEDGETQRRLVLALRKDSPIPLPINLRARSVRSMTSFRGDPDATTRYAVTGPGDEVVLEGTWRMGDDTRIEVAGKEPEGVYRLELDFPDDEGDFVLPVSEVDTPEVVVWSPDKPRLTTTEGTFWFMVPDGMEEFTANLPSGGSVWRPDGSRAWNQAEHPYADEAAVEVTPEKAGRLWRITIPMYSFSIDPRIPPYYATDPGRWFDPEQ